MGVLNAIFGGGGAIGAIENIASEWITTDMEAAEAKAVMVKTLDPNGLMRRDLSNRVTFLYTIYVLVTLALLLAESFGLSPSVSVLDSSGVVVGETLAVSVATEKIAGLFMPITTLFGVIVSASFGVNYANTKAGS